VCLDSDSEKAIQWAGTGVALLLLAIRLIIRMRTFRKLTLDDVFLIFAFACLIAYDILWTIQLPHVYTLIGVQAQAVPITVSVLEDVATTLRRLVAFNVLFVCCLWAVKASFLAFFLSLERDVPGKKIWSWIVVFVTVGTFVGSIGTYDWKCSRKEDIPLIRMHVSRNANGTTTV
jgi:hypothetical protein